MLRLLWILGLLRGLGFRLFGLRLGLRRLDNLNALDGATGFAAELIPELLGVAANYSDGDDVVLLVVHLVSNLREFAENLLDLLVALVTLKINLESHYRHLLFHGWIWFEAPQKLK